MVVQGLLDHCSTSVQTSVSMKAGLLGKAAMRSIYIEIQVLKHRELLNVDRYCKKCDKAISMHILYCKVMHKGTRKQMQSRMYAVTKATRLVW